MTVHIPDFFVHTAINVCFLCYHTLGELAVTGSFNWSDNGVTKGNTELVISLHQKTQIHETQLVFDALHSESN
jgi:phosphatidylserine/phosphatidylglycerophosphate/cardiolipin synthase-like enzyme